MQSWQETFGALKQKYLKRSSDRLAEILELLDGIIANPSDTELVRRLSRNFHWLAGSGSMYGFQNVPTLGSAGEQFCESALRGDLKSNPVDLNKLKNLVSELTAAFSPGSEDGDPQETTNLGLSEPVSSDTTEVLVVGEDQTNVAGLSRLVEELGMSVRLARNVQTTIQEVDRKMPDALLIEIPLSDGDAYELVEKVRGRPDGERPAIIIVSKQTGFLDKVRSIHCGADAHFERPVDLKAMIRRLKYLVDKGSQEPPRILSVEDDPDQAAFIRAFLESAGYQ
ncbi:MAG: response regulator, partial [Candidatus Obscuribacterales bacterium]|nr:response regulator [Candidatus Obscuribacterales bacterium]